MKKETIDHIFERWAKQAPEPRTELNYTNHYTLLVAVVLSAQATDIGVNKATKALFSKITTPQEMVALGEERLKEFIKTIGLFNSKAKNVIALSHRLIEQHDGNVPRDFESLCALPGVGTKTANVVLNCAFGEPTIAVDTHVFRVSNRIGLVKTKTARETEKKLPSVIPDPWKQHAHHWLILHGRYVCKARNPECSRCIIRDLCEFKHKNI